MGSRWRPDGEGRPGFRLVSMTFYLAAVLAVAGCGPGTLAAPSGELAADPTGFAAELRRASLPAGPAQITFAWTLDEQGSRVRGNGVVRTEPDRIRLDLFGTRGDTYLVAALIGDEYRLPPGAADGFTLPSPVLLWASLGVLHPPADGVLTSATTSATGADLLYEAGDQRFSFTFRAVQEGGYRLERVQREGRRGIVETVAIEMGDEGGASRVRYRDWAAYRDLTLDIESTRPAGPFPSSIWSPDAISN